MIQKFLKWFKRKEVAGSPSLAQGVNWFPVWEDPEMMKQIRFSVFKANPKSLRTETRINLQLVEFKTEIEEEIMPQIPLISVNSLMEKFKTVTPAELMRTTAQDGFKPRIVKIENPIYIIGDGIGDFETQIEILEEHNISEAGNLREKFQKMKNIKNYEVLMKEVHAALYNIFEKRPDLQKEASFKLGLKRTGSIKHFLGKDYCLLMSHYGKMKFDDAKGTASGGNLFPILIPLEGFKMLPYGNIFMGRVLGVTYLYPQPLFENMGPEFCLVAGAVSMGMRSEFLNR